MSNQASRALRAPVAPFGDAPAPAGYVPGLGRGAAGFTTRSDIGPGQVAAAGDKRDEDGGRSGDGGEDGLFGRDASTYDDDDAEADEIWAQIDERMDSRRRDARERREREQMEKFRDENPKIVETFRDLKRGLKDVSYAEWDAIPDIGDYTIKKKKLNVGFMPAPDTLLAKALAEKETVNTAADAGGEQDLTAVGEGRGTVLGLKLDRLSDSVTGQTTIDPKGYLTDLGSQKITSAAEISDIKKARLLLKSVINTNPKHGPGWIAAARLEELAGKLQQARVFMQKGCEECPKNEDVWIEAARLNTPENAKAILARGVQTLPNSVKIWMQAAQLEIEDERKRRVLRRALENVPNSVRLWKALVDLSAEDDAKVLLARATECCPQHVELWLALARLETTENGRKVLNKARETLPREPQIWITAAKLEEANGNEKMVEKIIARAVKSLKSHGVTIDRESWIKEAEIAEKAEPPSIATCRAIVKATIGEGVEEEDKKRTWKADAEECMKRESAETARAIYAHALDSGFSHKKGLWMKAAMLEKRFGTPDSVDAVLRKAVTFCPNAEILWLMGAKERWLSGDVTRAREILQSAFDANPDSEEIWLAAFKLEFENGEIDRARMLLAKARERLADCARVWMKSALVEREAGDEQAERKLLDEGIENGNASKARIILETARAKNPSNEHLWLAAVRQERESGNIQLAESTIARALQECPTSGLLLAESVRFAPRPQRKSKSVDALRRCDNDPYIIAAIAILFWADRKLDKARSWWNRAVTIAPDIGDHWASYYKFELQTAGEQAAQAVAERCARAAPRHGENWSAMRKRVENWHDPVIEILKKVAAGQDEMAYATK
ncbi:predicted protein [Ostreococcus lucimarinus CCE9901]|uniref:Uncharacterized protein n=1 Tax=Ostreococcus lucimarinus (strain CCE9901) TaxID=436017 RepID=A4SBF4_OSTLU|nr:predicted protein [Ostreococcus lucimarinus CCE9901]ABP00924.1 predicted protein [Ostreococcus lucimarinus CCE9901]|eukprot:XP_001422607.1 predicted protein [Ostreococcus lucimarinus CCE9901]